jgi:hypothetical protein
MMVIGAAGWRWHPSGKGPEIELVGDIARMVEVAELFGKPLYGGRCPTGRYGIAFCLVTHKMLAPV